jgi:hypothetical protein
MATIATIAGRKTINHAQEGIPEQLPVRIVIQSSQLFCVTVWLVALKLLELGMPPRFGQFIVDIDQENDVNSSIIITCKTRR